MTAGVLFICGLILTAMACTSLIGEVPAQAPTRVPPTLRSLATSTATPLYQQVQLISSPWADQGALYGYKITAQTPVLVGSHDPRVTAFNARMTAIVDAAAADFKQKLSSLPPSPDSRSSTFDLRFNRVSPPGRIISIRFDMQTYFTGAAHPADTSQAVTFDLDLGRELSLAELFVPGADFLATISKYCVAELNNRDIGFQGFELGATPTAANYRNWNIAPTGLMFTFDEYQVAPYAAGPQTVIIPFKVLAQIIRSDGSLGPYLQ
jgi:hypothetical protein